MTKIKKFFNDYILPKISDNEFFQDKNGSPSSKRLAGLFLVANGVFIAYLTGVKWFTVETALILGILTLGTGLLGLPKDQTL